jgi:hypothetical protein
VQGGAGDVLNGYDRVSQYIFVAGVHRDELLGAAVVSVGFVRQKIKSPSNEGPSDLCIDRVGPWGCAVFYGLFRVVFNAQTVVLAKDGWYNFPHFCEK